MGLGDRVRKRAGFILFVTGWVLFLKPNFDLEQIVYFINLQLVNYWPLILVALGFTMMKKSAPKPQHKH